MFSKLSLALLAIYAFAAEGRSVRRGDIIPDKYIVQLQSDTTEQMFYSLLQTLEDQFQSYAPGENAIDDIYMIGSDFKGLSGKFRPEMVQFMSEHPVVVDIEEDSIVTMDVATSTQLDVPSWGLARISQRDFGQAATDYIYPESGGEGVDIYVLDTGCHTAHAEFEGRVTEGPFFAGDSADDENGHGTHVMGTCLGATVGVAKKASGVCVRVLDGSGAGSVSGIISAIQWATQNVAKTKRPSIANMSLGGGRSYSLDKAVNAAATATPALPFVNAAGNEAQNACNVSPARAAQSITVAASDYNNRRPFWSNYGKCTHIFAPGARIYSSWNDGGYATLDGTSMATPHVTGVGALYLGEGVHPKELKKALTSNATPGIIVRPGFGSPNLFLYSIPEVSEQKMHMQKERKMSMLHLVRERFHM